MISSPESLSILSENMERKAKAVQHHGRKTKGTLEYRRSGWLARWMVNGQRYSRNTGTTDKAAAEAIMKTWMDALNSGTEEQKVQALLRRADEVASRTHTLADVWSQYKVMPKAGKYTAERERVLRSSVDHMAQWMIDHGAASMEDVVPEMALEYSKVLLAKNTQNTVAKATGLFDRVWRTVFDKTDNVWHGLVAKSNADEMVKEPLTDEEMERVLAAARRKGPQVYGLFIIGQHTALREGDAAQLRWEEVGDTEIRTKPDKTKRYGTAVRIPIDSVLRAELDALRPLAGDGYVLPCLAAMYHKRHQRLNDLVMAVFKQAGIQCHVMVNGRKRVRIGFHSLRHSWVSRMASAGVPMAVVGGIVGHKSTSMSLRYSHQNDEALAQVREALEGAKKDRTALEVIRELAKGMSLEEREEAVRILNGFTY